MKTMEDGPGVDMCDLCKRLFLTPEAFKKHKEEAHSIFSKEIGRLFPESKKEREVERGLKPMRKPRKSKILKEKWFVVKGCNATSDPLLDNHNDQIAQKKSKDQIFKPFHSAQDSIAQKTYYM